MILLLDNFDSFTFNLADYFAQLNVPCEVIRNDIEPNHIKLHKYKGLVLSPGPGTPESAGNMMAFIDQCRFKLPILGICLGHQALGQYFGATLIKGNKPMHGKISEIECSKDEIFKDLPEKFQVARYHSLVLSDLPECLTTIATSTEKEIMAIKHNTLPIYGLQYHPEAILTEFGKEILKNWIFLHKIVN